MHCCIYSSLPFNKCFPQGHILACNLFEYLLLSTCIYASGYGFASSILLLPLFFLLLSLNTPCPSSTKHSWGMGTLPQFTAREKEPGSQMYYWDSCWGGWRCQKLSLLPFPCQRLPSVQGDSMVFSLILSVWPKVEKKLLLPINQDLFAKITLERELAVPLAGLIGRQMDEE